MDRIIMMIKSNKIIQEKINWKNKIKKGKHFLKENNQIQFMKLIQSNK